MLSLTLFTLQEHIQDQSDPYCPLGKLIDHRSVGWPKGKGDWKWQSKNSLKFLTARHPYERLVSEGLAVK